MSIARSTSQKLGKQKAAVGVRRVGDDFCVPFAIEAARRFDLAFDQDLRRDGFRGTQDSKYVELPPYAARRIKSRLVWYSGRFRAGTLPSLLSALVRLTS